MKYYVAIFNIDNQVEILSFNTRQEMIDACKLLKVSNIEIICVWTENL